MLNLLLHNSPVSFQNKSILILTLIHNHGYNADQRCNTFVLLGICIERAFKFLEQFCHKLHAFVNSVLMENDLSVWLVILKFDLCQSLKSHPSENFLRVKAGGFSYAEREAFGLGSFQSFDCQLCSKTWTSFRRRCGQDEEFDVF